MPIKTSLQNIFAIFHKMSKTSVNYVGRSRLYIRYIVLRWGVIDFYLMPFVLFTSQLLKRPLFYFYLYSSKRLQPRFFILH